MRHSRRPRPLASRALTYPAAGVTDPGSDGWSSIAGFSRYERTVVIGTGDREWRRASADVLAWAVKTRSGFTISADDGSLEVREGADYWLTAHLGPLTVREPARVVAVVQRDDVCGFAYGTLPTGVIQ